MPSPWLERALPAYVEDVQISDLLLFWGARAAAADGRRRYGTDERRPAFGLRHSALTGWCTLTVGSQARAASTTGVNAARDPVHLARAALLGAERASLRPVRSRVVGRGRRPDRRGRTRVGGGRRPTTGTPKRSA